MGEAAIVQAFRTMQVPLMIVGEDGHILESNQAANGLFGYGDASMNGVPVCDALSMNSVEDLRSLIVPPAVDASVYGMTGRKRDGQEVSLAVQVTGWTDPARGLQHALVLRDVTEEMGRVQRRKEERRRANSAIQGAHIGVFEYNPIDDSVIVDGRMDVTRVRPLTRLGYKDYAVTDDVFEMTRPQD